MKGHRPAKEWYKCSAAVGTEKTTIQSIKSTWFLRQLQIASAKASPAVHGSRAPPSGCLARCRGPEALTEVGRMPVVLSSEARRRRGEEDRRGGVREDPAPVLLSQLTQRNCQPPAAHEGPGPEDTVTNETPSSVSGAFSSAGKTYRQFQVGTCPGRR